MTKLKRLAKQNENIVVIEHPITEEELKAREENYNLLIPRSFSNTHNELLFKPINFSYKNQSYSIQYNFCTNSFCKWYSLDQIVFHNAKSRTKKPSRYFLSDSSGSKNLRCNPDPMGDDYSGTTWECNSVPVSNWSIAEEIKRLATLEEIQDIKPTYQFHKDSCPIEECTPFTHKFEFYKQGKSKSNSQRWQCKSCKKITHVLPKQRENFSYHQKRNDILPQFTKLLLNRTPVKRACDYLKIGSNTYYNKLEWVYRRTLEFLDRYERKSLEQKQFDTIWLNTDKLIYNLNNVRKKGKGGRYYDMQEEESFQTDIVISGDLRSRYIFRADIAYDWEVSMEEIKDHTKIYKDDHLHLFAKKYGRLRRFTSYPQPPSQNDTQSEHEYKEELEKARKREQYADGVNVNATYTTIAHYFLLKNLVKTNKWRFVTDQDESIKSALFRVFNEEIKDKRSHHFIYKITKNKSLQEAYEEYMRATKELKEWGHINGIKGSLWKIAHARLLEELKYHSFQIAQEKDGIEYLKWAKNPIEHPVPSLDKGLTEVDITTDTSNIELEKLASMILRVNDHATSAFMQQIRRRISILERPLVTARGDRKSYIYANFNPKYAQYAITILRAYYNFCVPYKLGKRGSKLTPAQRLGITGKVFDLKDIIYFK